MKVKIGPYQKSEKTERKIEIIVHPYDVWNADHTLSLIIHPVLEKFKEDRTGLIFVSHEDVPEDLRKPSDEFNGFEWREDGCYHIDYMNYVIDEMIWTFKWLSEEDYTSTDNAERLDNGLRLFAKYYRNLWT